MEPVSLSDKLLGKKGTLNTSDLKGFKWSIFLDCLLRPCDRILKCNTSGMENTRRDLFLLFPVFCIDYF